MGPRTATVKALIHRIRTAEATQPPAYGLGPRHQHQPSFLVCLFLPSAWLRMVSRGSGPRPGSQIPLMVALEAMGSKWMIISGLCVSCFDRSWDIELSRAGEAMVTIRPTNYQAAGCCGHWIPAHSPRCWVTLSPGHHWLHHGSFLGNSGQHGHWRLCLDPANISDIYQTGNFNENKNMGAIGN